MPNRRSFMAMAAMAPATLAARPSLAQTGPLTGHDPFTLADLRGTANANELGLLPGTVDDQSRTLQSILDRAALEDKPVFLPPGNYFVSNILLPARTRLMGVPGASRLVYSGDGHFLLGENGEHVELTGLVLDGANRPIAPYAEAALRLNAIAHAVIDNCRISGSAETGIRIDRSAGRIERSTISGAGGACAIHAIESRGLAITANEVTDCANGGILVHRFIEGEDNTIVSGNRIARISARYGGTGQWGNGINVFRAANVMISGNHVTDCALSAIRSNAGNNVQITGNTCLGSGETAIYSEFEFNGALISSNIIDGGSAGISIANFMDGGRLAVCANNLVRNITKKQPYVENDHIHAVGIYAEAETTVSGNVIENATNFGIVLGWGPYLRNVIASSNIVRGARTGIYLSVADGAGPATITGNTISGASEAAIAGYAWHKRVTGDLSLGAEGVTGNPAIHGNSVS